MLALMAALTGLVLPQLAKLFDAGQRSFERAQAIDAMAALSYEAFVQQKGFTLVEWPGQADEIPLELPEGWTLKAAGEAGVRYRSNGFCSGGTVLLDNGFAVEEFFLPAPLCEPLQR